MKVIFLDIDGVLNTDRWDEYMLANALPLEDEFGIFFDEEAVENLAKIISLTKAEIVIHSTWKLGKSLDWMRSLWKKRNLPGHIRSITPDIPPYFNKTDEIAAWLSSNPDVTGYIILDDEDEFSPSQTRHLIRVNPAIGISAENVDAVIIRRIGHA